MGAAAGFRARSEKMSEAHFGVFACIYCNKQYNNYLWLVQNTFSNRFYSWWSHFVVCPFKEHALNQ